MKILFATVISIVLYYCIPTKLTAQVTTSDSLALVDLYNSTGGTLWANTTGHWLTGPVKQWFGVTLSATRVVKLNLGNNNLKGSIPASIGSLTSLDTLLLNNNSLAGAIPAGINSLANLVYLDLSTNNLSGSLPAGLSGLASLNILALNNNSFTGTIPAQYGSFAGLQYLALSNNPLSGSVPAALANLPQLAYLYLNDDNLTGSIPPELGNITTLRDIEMYSNALTGNIPKQLAHIPNLSSLNIGNNQLSGAIPAEIGSMASLHNLFLEGNQLSGTIPASLLGLTNLSALSLENNKFTFAGLEAVVQKFPFATYSPQANIGIKLNGDKLIVKPGGNTAHNTYMWFKNGAPLATINGNDTLTITGSGEYNVTITNSVATLLTISSFTIQTGDAFASFTASVTYGIAPLTVNFQGFSTGSPQSFKWDFGNGQTSTLQNPGNVYTKPGYYKLSLTVVDENTQSDTYALDSFIVVYPEPGIITSPGGTGTAGYTGDGGLATQAELNHPAGLALDHFGNIFIADAANNALRAVLKPSGTITTTAGNGTAGNKGDHGKATTAQLNGPSGVFVNKDGNIFISDTKNHTIRMVDAAGIITTVAGTGTATYGGDNGAATLASLNNPAAITGDSKGNLYIADAQNNRIRKISAAGIITTVAGNGTAGYSGDKGPATSAKLNQPYSVAVDTAGNLYIADTKNNVIRKVSKSGIITTIAGKGIAGYTGDYERADTTEFNNPQGISVDTAGTVYISDTYNNRIRVLKNNIVYTIAGGNTPGYSGDNDESRKALVNHPAGIIIAPGGSIYIADENNNVVRKIDDTTKNILPLTLLGFTAAPVNNNVQCDWTTANEKGVSRFVIERSNDSKHFSALDSLAARQTGTAANHYSYTDNTILKRYSNILYYRLRMMDKDGTATYSPTRKVVFDNALLKLIVLPNPVHGNSFAVQLPAAVKLPAEYRLVDMNGKVVQHGTITASGQAISLPSTLSAGNYVLTLASGEKVMVLKQ